MHITRDGDYAIIEYADPAVATTHFKVGAEKLHSMTDIEFVPDDELHERPRLKVRDPDAKGRSALPKERG